MLIRFFKENDLIGCGGDPQPIRLQEHTGVRAQGCVHRGKDDIRTRASMCNSYTLQYF